MFYQSIILKINTKEKEIILDSVSEILSIQKENISITFIEADKAQSISIDQIRVIVEESSKKDVLGKIRIFALVEADGMKDVAQNSLLKILEEPPQDVVFVLVVEDMKKILQTLHSRCKKVEYITNIEKRELTEARLLSNILEKKDGNKQKNVDKKDLAEFAINANGQYKDYNEGIFIEETCDTVSCDKLEKMVIYKSLV